MAASENSLSASPVAIVNQDTAVEDTPLLGHAEPQKRVRRSSSLVGNTQHGYHTIPASTPEAPVDVPQHSAVRLIRQGVFISQTDFTLLLATIGDISSEFNDLQSSAWLFSSFGLATCVAQPLYGKLSDIFGRKTMLQVAYFLFALGGLICGIGRSMPEIVVGRVIQGSGGAGMVALVSVLITDLVPLREVAAYRSYVNIVSTVGRSSGGPIGGALAQTIGWRWAFLIQAPLTGIAMVLVAWRLNIQPKMKSTTKADEDQSIGAKLKRIDFVGAIFMSTTILAAAMILDMGGDKVSWASPTIGILAGATVLSGIMFYVTEKYWAKEPIFPLHLLSHKHLVLDYVLLTVQLMLYIALYFQLTNNASEAVAGAYMVPSVMGNTVGGLVTGSYIKRTGRYKLPIIISGFSAILCFTLLLITWHGNTPVWQAFFVFFGGFATGIANSAVFVDLAATVDESEIAIASSGLYLSTNIGAVGGVSVASAIFGNSLKTRLADLLSNWPDGQKVAEKAASNIEYVQGLTGQLHRLVISAYVFAFRQAFVFSLCCAVCALLLGLILKEKKLHR
ncbi:MFS general substrate transporter [Rhizodiscina lignyota]|uniref:MFS general substrate transporter n=1 Tax=Rhizodiscina lignyota TaxID=1504668 RepID=A0A9P4IJ59_9PEZI|nr:MFS general substrate transporter [Rhizodiscina lignyota]